MRSRLPLYCSLVVSLAFTLSGCSVKSDRGDCPCLLDLSVSGGDEGVAQLSVLDAGGRRVETQRKVLTDSRTEVEIPRGEVTLCLVSGLHGCERDGTVIRTAAGCEMDEVYCWCSMYDTDRESVTVDAVLHKQYALAHISVGGSDEGWYPYYVRICGNVCGFDAVTLSPVPGPYSVTLHPVIGEYHRICLPRQSDESLTLELLDKDGTKSDAIPISTLPLGQYISGSGFDWTETDLKDIYIDIDYAEASVTVIVVPWNEVDLRRFDGARDRRESILHRQ